MHADLNSILMELLMAEVSALLRAKKIWDQYRESSGNLIHGDQVTWSLIPVPDEVVEVCVCVWGGEAEGGEDDDHEEEISEGLHHDGVILAWPGPMVYQQVRQADQNRTWSQGRNVKPRIGHSKVSKGH